MTSTVIRARKLLGQRSPRERRLIAVAAVVVLAGITVMVADWSVSERDRVRAQLSQARAALAEMQADAAKLQHLTAERAPSRPTPDAAAEIIMATARAHEIILELEVSGTSLKASGSGHLPTILGLIANLQSDFGLRPSRVVMLPVTPVANFEIEFVSPAS